MTTHGKRGRTARSRLLPTILVLLALVATSCGGDDDTASNGGNDAAGSDASSRQITVGIAVANTFDYLPSHAGVDLGVWEERGLDVEVQAFAGDAKLQQAMAAGQVDFGIGTAAAGLPAIEAGQDIRFVAAVSNTVGLFGIVATEDITDVEDLAGKTIGITGPNAITDILVQLLSEQVTGDAAGGITRQPLGPFDAQMAALSSGQIDGFVWTLDGLILAEQAGYGQRVAMFDEEVGDLLYAGIFTSSATIDDDPELVETFLAGWFEAQRRLAEDRDYAVGLFEEKMQVPADVGGEVWDIDHGNLTTDGAFDDAAYDALLTALEDLEIVSDPATRDAGRDDQFLPVTENER